MKSKITQLLAVLLILTGLTNCQDFFNLDSDQVLYSEENKLDSPTDTVYSVIGILNKMQVIADRTVLLGELRGDLVSLTQDADLQLQALADFNAGTDNVYNKPEDYYAIINNCNYFLAYADTALRKRNYPVFIKDYAAVKGFRAWTYLQLAQIYGSVPFVTEPVLTEKMANAQYPKKDIYQLAEYFIEDLKPYINTPFPAYGNIAGYNSQKFYIPIRLILGDYCLWSERYKDAAQYYHDFLTQDGTSRTVDMMRVQWNPQTNTFDRGIYDSYSSIFTSSSSEIISYIPMETNKFNGLVSKLPNVFNSTTDNKYHFQATVSAGLHELSRKQSYCKVYLNPLSSTKDTLFAPVENPTSDLYSGDLRMSMVYTRSTVNTNRDDYSSAYQTISKISTSTNLYRKSQIYLRYAEAMNRAGFPTAAFAVLKYGLTQGNIDKYVDTVETKHSGTLLSWNKQIFTENNTIGIHSKGSGDTYANYKYKIPALAGKADTINYVENLILDEMALETTFEGFRYFDLIRFAQRKPDPAAFLGSKIGYRRGSAHFDATIADRLKTKTNWYLPLR